MQPDSPTARQPDSPLDADALGFSPDGIAQRREELLALIRRSAPEIISDNQLDLERLKELLGEERLAPAEHYELNWAGKTAARREIQKTSSHTLRPAPGNPAHAPHMLIEGENLEVLRVLQKSYHGKVKMIYIDPPYNTGNDSFVYPDDYSETLDEYQRRTGEKNEAGFLNKQSLWKKNSKESGQYHSAWLSMMYPRLYLARNLLREDGVIFISIDDNEAANLKLLCDEVFGEENRIETFIWESIFRPSNMSKRVRSNAEFLIAYAKNANRDFELIERYEDPQGDASLTQNNNKPRDLTFPARSLKITLPPGTYSVSASSDIQLKTQLLVENGTNVQPWTVNGRFKWSQDYLEGEIDNGVLLKIKTETLIPYYRKVYQQTPLRPKKIIPRDLVGDVLAANAEISGMFDRAIFDYPKPTSLLTFLMRTFGINSHDIILDFFAGSGTAAHAVMQLNLEDGGNRQCICVQMPEVLDESSEAYKAGYRTIADITRARIDKVIAKLKADSSEPELPIQSGAERRTPNLACAHFTLAPSNFKIWRGDVTDADALREQMELFQQAEKSGGGARQTDSQTAMLAELLLKHGLGALGVDAISKPLTVAGVTVHRVLMPDDRLLWLCFDPYTKALKEEIVKAKPAQVILLNSCFTGDKADESLSNLQLELAGLEIGLTVI